MRNHERIYARNLIFVFAVYAALLILCITLLRNVESTPLRIVISLLPMLPLLYGFRSFMLNLSQMDELQQKIQLQAIGFAAGATAIITMTYGFLEIAGLPQISKFWVFPLLCFLWGGASFVLTRKYQ